MHRYSNEKNVQILISILKQNGIHKVVVSPGTTNLSFVASLQSDSFFSLYSVFDERSAAYFACGLSEESGEPVVLSCTGATASRNYLSALTEAFYRKIPLIAVTSSQYFGRIGNGFEQVIDRGSIQNDVVKLSVRISSVKTEEDEWSAINKINRCILTATGHRGGPVHIDLETEYSQVYDCMNISKYKAVKRYYLEDEFPSLDSKKVAIFVGTHSVWSKKMTESVDRFCEIYNSFVLCDNISNYKGKYGLPYSLLNAQRYSDEPRINVDIVIHIGTTAGIGPGISASEIWRVNPDGELFDSFRKLVNVFEMEEEQFFFKYTNQIKAESSGGNTTLFKAYYDKYCGILSLIPELPFSNCWIAQNTYMKIPSNSRVHLGIKNSLRSWSFFKVPEDVFCYSNTGGYGIDGCTSTLIGASMNNTDTLYFLVSGDLAFFYDLNVIGNRHVGSNVRILLINNGLGMEFKNYNHPASKFGKEANKYMAAEGHNGKKSNEFVKHMATDLGFVYMAATNKPEFLSQVDEFCNWNHEKKPVVFEVFTNETDEKDALQILHEIDKSGISISGKIARNIVGEEGLTKIKKFIGR